MSQGLEFHKSGLEGLVRIERQSGNDIRGSFSRLFCTQEFQKIGLTKPIVQINHSVTKNRGTIRGMHFQHPPNMEAKIVTCMRGRVLDVAVDIRSDSETFLQLYAQELSERNQTSLYVPEGFAHGFQSLTDDCHILYLHTGLYTPGSEGGLNAQDPLIAIDWPLEARDISERDLNLPLLDSKFTGIEV